MSFNFVINHINDQGQLRMVIHVSSFTLEHSDSEILREDSARNKTDTSCSTTAVLRTGVQLHIVFWAIPITFLCIYNKLQLSFSAKFACNILWRYVKNYNSISIIVTRIGTAAGALVLPLHLSRTIFQMTLILLTKTPSHPIHSPLNNTKWLCTLV